MDEEKSKIDRLKDHLDSRSFRADVNNRSRLPKRDTDGIKRDWSGESRSNYNDESSNLDFTAMPLKKRRNFLKLFLMGSILFFIVSVAVASFVLFGGGNIVSSDNVDISISGPTSVSGGEILSLSVIVLNKNNSNLELADLIIEYPEGTRSAEDLSRSLPRERFSLGDVKANGIANQEIKALLFGEEGQKQKIKLTVEYRISGSNAIFFKEREYEVEISSSPISLNVSSLVDVNSGQEISLDIKLKSNSTSLLEDVLFMAEYPFGFLFKSALPRPSFDRNVWKIGDIAPGQEKSIKITGVIEGQDEEERVFRFFGGTQSKDNERELETAFVSSAKSIFIKKPFLATDIIIDGRSSGNYSAGVGQTVQVEISWQNNLPTTIANVFIEAKLSGDFDETSFFVDRGFYDSLKDTVTWSQERNPVFESIKPGERGAVSFRFRSPFFGSVTLNNPEAEIDVSVRGRRLSENNVSEEIVSTVSRKIRFLTDLSLLPRIVHSSGPIENSGPMPPKAENETTYTVIWTLNNTVNDVSDASVSTTLPSYVKWTGKTSSNESLNYNPVTREVTWDVGRMPAGTGASFSSREAYFQISFLPSISQIGQSQTLIAKSRFGAKDDFTGSLLEGSKGELSTRISTDPSYREGDEKVVE